MTKGSNVDVFVSAPSLQQRLEEAKSEYEIALQNLDYASEEYVETAIHCVNAARSKLDNLIREAKVGA